MSGPKVVRIVTREEILARCAADLLRLSQALTRWQTQAHKLGELTDAEYAATLARHERLRGLLRSDQLAELQEAVPVEIEYLKRDLAEREERAVLRATEARQRQRRVQENAATLLKALQARPLQIEAQLQQALTRLAKGSAASDADSVLAEGFALLSSSAPAEASLSAEQQALAQQLKTGDASPSLANWIARQPQDATRDPRLQRIDRHIAELQLLQGTDTAQAFVNQLEKAENESRIQTRNLLLDSLVLDLAQATRHYQQQRMRFGQLQDLADEVSGLADAAHDELLQKIAACTADTDLQQIATLIDQCTAVIAAHLHAHAALARRQAVLEGLSSLGYEVREGMQTAWAETGRVVLRKAATPGFGVEVGGKAENGRLQVRAVALSRDHDKQRERDIETIWCGEFQRLQALLKSQGSDMTIEQALGIGQVELKVVSMDEQRQEASTASQTVPNARG
ncbi:MAG: hypothetical protein ACN6O6_13500 [Pseudomonas sp.]|uniref:hypothetical protein n=1 Tax=Pseudomonas sp. TaxID=306 RepID=UPI003D111817